MMSSWGRAAGVVLLAGWLSTLAPVAATIAFAHAYLERAEPTPGSAIDQPPPELRLEFSEAVDPSFSKIVVLDDRKNQVDKGDSHVVADNSRAMAVSLPS